MREKAPVPVQPDGPPVVTRSQATPQQRVAHTAELRAKAERLLELKDQMAAMQREAATLSDDIKALMQAGYRADVQGQRPVLRPSRKRVIEFRAFQSVFGQKLALECAAIDLKAVDALVRSGQIDRQEVARVTQHIEGAPALHWADAPDRAERG